MTTRNQLPIDRGQVSQSQKQWRVHPSFQNMSAGAALPAQQIDMRIVTELTQLTRGGLRFRSPVPITVNWSQPMACFVAMDEVFHWHGQGDSVDAAKDDLADVIVEDYESLRNWHGKLSKPLQERLAILMRYIEDAG